MRACKRHSGYNKCQGSKEREQVPGCRVQGGRTDHNRERVTVNPSYMQVIPCKELASIKGTKNNVRKGVVKNAVDACVDGMQCACMYS